MNSYRGPPRNAEGPTNVNVGFEVRTNNASAGDQDAQTPSARLAFLGVVLLGYRVEVTTTLGEVYEGVFNTLKTEDDGVCVVIKYARLIKAPGGRSLFSKDELAQKPELTKMFPASQVAQLMARDVGLSAEDVGADGDMGFGTDAAISRGRGGQERELQRWAPAEGESDMFFALDGPDISLTSPGGKWDQFAANQSLYGVSTTYDEHMYTTKIDRDKCGISELEAERLAREIEQGVSSTSNVHLLEERGGELDANVDEEALYGAVVRTPAPAPALSGLGSGRAPLHGLGLGDRDREAGARRGGAAAPHMGCSRSTAGPGHAPSASRADSASTWVAVVAGTSNNGMPPPPPPPPREREQLLVPAAPPAAPASGFSAPFKPAQPAYAVPRDGTAPINIDPRQEVNRLRHTLAAGPKPRDRTSPYGTPNLSRSPNGMVMPLVDDFRSVLALDLDPGSRPRDLPPEREKEFRKYKEDLERQREKERIDSLRQFKEKSLSPPADGIKAAALQEVSVRASPVPPAPPSPHGPPAADGSASAASTTTARPAAAATTPLGQVAAVGDAAPSAEPEKKKSSLNPFAKSFSLNPTAKEFVPSFCKPTTVASAGTAAPTADPAAAPAVAPKAAAPAALPVVPWGAAAEAAPAPAVGGSLAGGGMAGMVPAALSQPPPQAAAGHAKGHGGPGAAAGGYGAGGGSSSGYVGHHSGQHAHALAHAVMRPSYNESGGGHGGGGYGGGMGPGGHGAGGGHRDHGNAGNAHGSRNSGGTHHSSNSHNSSSSHAVALGMNGSPMMPSSMVMGGGPQAGGGMGGSHTGNLMVPGPAQHPLQQHMPTTSPSGPSLMHGFKGAEHGPHGGGMHHGKGDGGMRGGNPGVHGGVDPAAMQAVMIPSSGALIHAMPMQAQAGMPGMSMAQFHGAGMMPVPGGQLAAGYLRPMYHPQQVLLGTPSMVQQGQAMLQAPQMPIAVMQAGGAMPVGMPVYGAGAPGMQFPAGPQVAMQGSMQHPPSPTSGSRAQQQPHLATGYFHPNGGGFQVVQMGPPNGPGGMGGQGGHPGGPGSGQGGFKNGSRQGGGHRHDRQYHGDNGGMHGGGMRGRQNGHS